MAECPHGSPDAPPFCFCLAPAPRGRRVCFGRKARTEPGAGLCSMFLSCRCFLPAMKVSSFDAPSKETAPRKKPMPKQQAFPVYLPGWGAAEKAK